MTKADLAIWPVGSSTRPYDTLITGHLKLVQRFLIELFTPKGSDIYRPTRGTDFYRKWQAGITTEAQLTTSFALSEYQARNNLQLEETDTDPDNERYVNTIINSIIIDGTAVKLNLTINSRNGTNNVTIPLNLL